MSFLLLLVCRFSSSVESDSGSGDVQGELLKTLRDDMCHTEGRPDDTSPLFTTPPQPCHEGIHSVPHQHGFTREWLLSLCLLSCGRALVHSSFSLCLLSCGRALVHLSFSLCLLSCGRALVHSSFSLCLLSCGRVLVRSSFSLFSQSFFFLLYTPFHVSFHC